MIPSNSLMNGLMDSFEVDPEDDLLNLLTRSDLAMPMEEDGDLLQTTSIFDTTDMNMTSGPLCPASEVMSEVKQDNNTGILSDCMWSSALNFLDSVRNQPGRNREDSLTLSECAESLFKDIKDIDNILKFNNGDLKIDDDQITQHSLEEDEDLEIDVVSDCDSMTSTSTSSSTLTSSSTGSILKRKPMNQPTIKHKPGQSLLTKNHRQQRNPRSLLRSNRVDPKVKGKVLPEQQSIGHPEPPSQTLIDHMNGDHCYFQRVMTSTPTPIPGLVTPNDSCSEAEEEENVKQQTEWRKLNSGVQHPNSVKFKFRMKFKAGKGQNEEQDKARAPSKRKSAIENPHCPSPKKVKVSGGQRKKTSTNNNNISMGKKSVQMSQSSRVNTSPRSPKSTSVSTTTSPSSTPRPSNVSAEQKSREIRDLHNSMERQRRIDLRKNFDHVRTLVPELRGVEKASKLNILNKSADYCKLLANNDSLLSKQKEQEVQKNQMLKKRYAQLMASFGNCSSTSAKPTTSISKPNNSSGFRITNSQRVSVVSGRHSGRVV